MRLECFDSFRDCYAVVMVVSIASIKCNVERLKKNRKYFCLYRVRWKIFHIYKYFISIRYYIVFLRVASNELIEIHSVRVIVTYETVAW